MADRVDWLARIKGAEREREVVAVALGLLDDRLSREPSTLTDRSLNAGHLSAARDGLDRTFLLRMVTEFEAALRNYWRDGIGRRTEPRMKSLIDAVASRQRTPTDILKEAHEVREWRNAVAHHAATADAMPFGVARRRLCLFVSFLPEHW